MSQPNHNISNNNNSMTEITSSLFPPLSQDDGIYRFIKGKDCNFDLLRSKILTGTNPSSSSPSPSAVINENVEDVLYQLPSVSVTIQNNNNNNNNFENVQGCLILTTRRVFFLSTTETSTSKASTTTASTTTASTTTNSTNNNDHDKDHNQDFCIDAQCISLHAMMSEPQASVYCQLALLDGSTDDHDDDDDNDDDDESIKGPVEIFFSPILTTNQNHEQQDEKIMLLQVCETLFQSFSKLINLNPVNNDDDDDNDEYGGGGNSFGGLGAMLGMLTNQNYYSDDDNDDHDNDEMICRIDPSQIDTINKNGQGEAGLVINSERSAMLQRLDDMLVVPPQYEIDGQFDDAEGDDDDNDDEADQDATIDNDDNYIL